MKDPNETVHAYEFDELGRQIQDRVTAIAAHLDNSVLRIARSYNQQGRLSFITSYDNDTVGMGNVVNQVGYEYDTLESAPNATGDWSSTMQFAWDAWNRLVEVADESGTPLGAYQYDGLFRRTTRTVSGTVHHNYYNDGWKYIEERLDASTNAERQYVWGQRPGFRDDLILRDRDTDSNRTLDERLYCLRDYFDPTSVVNTSGVVQERYAFTAFGRERFMAADWSARSSSNFDWTYGFHGEFTDTESGLHNYIYRHYSAFLGRWLSRDRIAENGGSHLYRYVNNCPVNRMDALGQYTVGGEYQLEDEEGPWDSENPSDAWTVTNEFVRYDCEEKEDQCIQCEYNISLQVKGNRIFRMGETSKSNNRWDFIGCFFLEARIRIEPGFNSEVQQVY